MDQWIEDEERAEETDRRRKARRRAAVVGLAGVMLLVATAVVANGVLGDDGPDAEAVAETDTDTIGSRRDPSWADSDLLRAERFTADRRVAAERAAAQQAAAEQAAAEQAAAEQAAAEQAAAEQAAAEQAAAEQAAAEQAAAEQAPTAADSGGGAGDPYSYASWDLLAQCESGGNWSINTGNGYYGGVQFSLSSWRAVGGTGYPHQHSRETQITMAIRLWEIQGWGAWPACTAELGWR